MHLDENAASRPRMLTADEVEQLRKETKRAAALLRAHFAKLPRSDLNKVEPEDDSK